MAQVFRALGIGVLALGLVACTAKQEAQRKAADDYQEGDGFSLRSLIGATSTPPDEFAVIATAPLQMPDDLSALPPPTPGARSALIADPVEEARSVLLGASDAPRPASTRVSSGESALLAATGSPVDSGIRATLAAEQSEEDSGQNSYLLDRVFPSFRRARGADVKDAIRPAEERERLGALQKGPRSFEKGDVISTIPPAPGRLPATPIEDQPLIDAVTTGAQPPIDPVAGGELIYIPE